MLQMLQSVLQRALRRGREESRLVVTEEGFAHFEDDREIWRIRWADVTRIETYKVDIFSMDMICVDFFVGSEQRRYSTNEDMQGFDILREQLRVHFPSVPGDWWPNVAFPAFAPNHRVLYEKLTATAPNDLGQRL